MLILSVAVQAYASPTTWVVTVDGSPSLQEALEQVGAGDTVDIGPGTYTGIDITLDDLSNVTLRGAGSGPQGTVIRPGIFDTLAWFSGCSNLWVEGLTIEGAGIVQLVDVRDGTSATFVDVRLTEAVDSLTEVGGAAMRVRAGSSAHIVNGTIEGNTTSGLGALMVEGTATVASSLFADNESEEGGGMACNFGSSCTITGSTFRGNLANRGGGLQFHTVGSAEVTHSVFCDNESRGDEGDGGGIMMVDSDASIANNLFLYNDIDDNGSGIYVQNGSDATVTNNTFIGNTAGDLGGAIYAFGSNANANVTNNLMVDSTASKGALDAGAVNLRNNATIVGSHNLFWNNQLENFGGGVDLMDSVTKTDPLLPTLAGDCTDATVVPDPAGPTTDAGDPKILDPDGSPSDIGATGGPGAIRDRDNDKSIDGIDCDDLDPTRSPLLEEVCGGGDEDCDGLVDDEDGSVDPSTFPTGFLDLDGDGVGGDVWDQGCVPPAPLVAEGGDCDDGAATAFPGAPEACDGIDNDCNGAIDEGCGSFRGDSPLQDPPGTDGCSCSTPPAAGAWGMLWLTTLLVGARRRQRDVGRSVLRKPAITPFTVPNQ